MDRLDDAEKSREGYAKLLDAWSPPRDAGDPIGCVATSFTFDAVFFEEDCLGRFLRIESNPEEDGAIYLIEREEKLAQSTCAAIVDRHHCRGERSLRWDLLPAHVPGGVLHAKIAVLRWQSCVRLLVASANLTDPGYRRNQEVFSVIDFMPNARAPAAAFESMVDLVSVALAERVEADRAARDRAVSFLAETRDLVAQWDCRPQNDIRVEAVTVAPGGASAIEQLAAIFPSPAALAIVLSPFFDEDAGESDAPSRALWTKVLRQRGEASVRYLVVAEDVPGSDAVLVHAPESLARAAPKSRSACDALFEAVDLPPDRPLHAKSMWIDADRWAALVVGSSNFTSAGLGLRGGGGSSKSAPHGGTNVEANLVYVVRSERHRKVRNRLQKALPDAKPIPAERELLWQSRSLEGEDAPGADDAPLPPGFKAAVYRWRDGAGALVLRFESPGTGWAVLDEAERHTVLDEVRWRTDGAEPEVVLDWPDQRPPSGLVVRLDTLGARAWWPVTVDSMASLPPPEELRDLPLDVLVDILTSARPLHRHPALRRHLRALARKANGDGRAIETDPHRNVDTSTFLLQRTRRVGWALAALRERLERPVASKAALEWRLAGPVGVRAVAEAIVREVEDRDTRNPEEQAFLIVEMILEIHRARPVSAPGCLPAEEVRERLVAFAGELRRSIPPEARSGSSMLADYVERSFAAIADG